MIHFIRQILILFFGATLSLSMFGQSLDNFTTLRSNGPIPADFTKLSTTKFNEDYAKNLDEELGKEFFLSTRFFVDELLLSGQILFNEPLSEYVSKVAEYVLGDSPKLKSELRFYVLKSNVVNAFTTDQGIVICTTGLLAHLENEAQLAFILAHEITHYVHNHVKSGYLEYMRSQETDSEYEELTNEMKLKKLSQYNQDMEYFADSEGLLQYSKTDYPKSEVLTTFVVLAKADWAFEDRVIDTSFLNTQFLTIPPVFFSDLLPADGPISVNNDAFQTHPNIDSRIKKLENISSNDSSLKSKFIVYTQTGFEEIRDLARFESVNIDLCDRRYVNALYSVYVLQKKFKSNRFLDLCLVKSLYGIAKYKNHNRYEEVNEYRLPYDGARFGLHGLFDQLSPQQCSIIAYRHAYDLSLKYLGDPWFEVYEKDLKRELAVFSGINSAWLTNRKFVVRNTLVKSGGKKTTFNSEENKTTHIRNADRFNKNSISISSSVPTLKPTLLLDSSYQMLKSENKDFHLHALADCVDSGLVGELNVIKSQYDLDQLSAPVYTKKDFKRQVRTGQSMGYEKIVIVDPIVTILKSDERINHLKSEKQKLRIQNVYEESNQAKLGMDIVVVDSKNLGDTEVLEYNNLGTLKQWVYEVFLHADMQMIPSTKDQLSNISEQYNCDKFLFSLVELRKDRPRPTWIHFLGFFAVVTIPVVILDFVFIQNYLNMVSIVIDSKSNQVEFVDVVDVEVYGREHMVNNYVYDVLYQLSREPKKK